MKKEEGRNLLKQNKLKNIFNFLKTKKKSKKKVKIELNNNNKIDFLYK